MSVYVDMIGNDNAAPGTGPTQMFGGVSATRGTWPVPLAGRLIGVIITLAGQAATSLIENVVVTLSCTTFQPNNMRFGAPGGALRTAPAFPIPMMDYNVDQTVNTSQQINPQWGVNVTAVTPSIQVFGKFSTNPVAMTGSTLPLA